MARPLTSGRLVIASHNAGKVREIADLMKPFEIEVVSAKDLDLAEPEEIGATFRENAEIKARAAAVVAHLPALADDSGLVVPAIGGNPGIHSARWGGDGKDFALAMRRVEDALAGHLDRQAHFVCALALAWPDQHCEVFEGRVFGELVWPPRGIRGFGYDPMFVPAGEKLTFGEMAPDAKHRISHRAEAFRKLVRACLSRERR